MTIAIGGEADGTIIAAMRQLLHGTAAASIAVSYVQLSGWELMRAALPAGTLPRLRVICTDQLGITDPAAVRAMIAAGVALRCYVGRPLFHPKVVIGHAGGRADRFVLGSANLSYSALTTGVEVDIAGEDADCRLGQWFDALFADPARCVAFDDARIAALERSFSARLRQRLAARATVPANAAAADADEIVGSLLDGLPAMVTPLNFDKGGSTVRNLGRIREVLDDPTIMQGDDNTSRKNASDMKQMRFADDRRLNAFGLAARQTQSREALAAMWMRWLKHAPEDEVRTRSPSGRLRQAQHAFATFSTFPEEVYRFWQDTAEKPSTLDKGALQTIELLANTGRALPGLTLATVAALTPLLSNTAGLPPRSAEAVQNYLNDKGARGWDIPDRRLAVEAWRAA